MQLKELQNKFIDALYDKAQSGLLAEVVDGKRSKEDLLAIYRNNLFGNLTNALRITYPKTQQKLGQKKFQKLCHDFIKKTRSRSGNLDDYGEGFADEIEWLKHKAYLAPDIAPVDPARLSKLPAEKIFKLKFKLHPSCFLYKNFLIYRDQNLQVHAKKISRAEMNFLCGVRDGLSLYEIYAAHDINIEICLRKYLVSGVLIQMSQCVGLTPF